MPNLTSLLYFLVCNWTLCYEHLPDYVLYIVAPSTPISPPMEESNSKLGRGDNILTAVVIHCCMFHIDLVCITVSMLK